MELKDKASARGTNICFLFPLFWKRKKKQKTSYIRQVESLPWLIADEKRTRVVVWTRSKEIFARVAYFSRSFCDIASRSEGCYQFATPLACGRSPKDLTKITLQVPEVINPIWSTQLAQPPPYVECSSIAITKHKRTPPVYSPLTHKAKFYPEEPRKWKFSARK